MEMIMVYDAKVMRVPQNRWQIAKASPTGLSRIHVGGDDFLQMPSIEQEEIVGERFVGHDGQERCIGWSEHVGKILGMPMKAFRTMSDEISVYQIALEQCRSRSTMHQKRLQKYETASFWRRLKYLFIKSID